LADALVEDDAAAIAAAVREAFGAGLPAVHRSADVARWLARIAAVDPAQPLDGRTLRTLWQEG
jgi:malonate decarboxylase beta subunit